MGWVANGSSRLMLVKWFWCGHQNSCPETFFLSNRPRWAPKGGGIGEQIILAVKSTTDLNSIASYYQLLRFFTRPMKKISTLAHLGIINVKNLVLHFHTYVLLGLKYRKVKNDFYITNSFMTTCRDFLHWPCKNLGIW